MLGFRGTQDQNVKPEVPSRFDDRVLELLDFTVYLDISDEVKFAWKIQVSFAMRCVTILNPPLFAFVGCLGALCQGNLIQPKKDGQQAEARKVLRRFL